MFGLFGAPLQAAAGLIGGQAPQPTLPNVPPQTLGNFLAGLQQGPAQPALSSDLLGILGNVIGTLPAERTSQKMSDQHLRDLAQQINAILSPMPVFGGFPFPAGGAAFGAPPVNFAQLLGPVLPQTPNNR